MEKFSAHLYFMLGSYLKGARLNFENEPATLRISAGAIKEGTETHEVFTSIKALCDQIGLRISKKCVDDILNGAAEESTVQAMIGRLSQLENTIQWEMEDRLFMYIPPIRAQRYDLPEPLGTSVAKNFPSCSFDAIEAGNCFAGGRFTACVFHLMRVLEIGLIAFGKIFQNVPTEKENWQQIIEKIESEIRAMPQAIPKRADWKEKQEKYSQLASSFMFFKDAWRNYTAHARGKYTEDESDAIYRNVRSFMQGLAAQGISE